MDVLIAAACMLAFGLALRFTIWRPIVARDRRERQYQHVLDVMDRSFAAAAKKMRWVSRTRRKEVEQAQWDDLFEGSLDWPRTPPRVSYSEIDIPKHGPISNEQLVRDMAGLDDG